MPDTKIIVKDTLDSIVNDWQEGPLPTPEDGKYILVEGLSGYYDLLSVPFGEAIWVIGPEMTTITDVKRWRWFDPTLIDTIEKNNKALATYILETEERET